MSRATDSESHDGQSSSMTASAAMARDKIISTERLPTAAAAAETRSLGRRLSISEHLQWQAGWDAAMALVTVHLDSIGGQRTGHLIVTVTAPLYRSMNFPGHWPETLQCMPPLPEPSATNTGYVAGPLSQRLRDKCLELIPGKDLGYLARTMRLEKPQRYSM
jgi:hypothetical protein